MPCRRVLSFAAVLVALLCACDPGTREMTLVIHNFTDSPFRMSFDFDGDGVADEATDTPIKANYKRETHVDVPTGSLPDGAAWGVSADGIRSQQVDADFSYAACEFTLRGSSGQYTLATDCKPGMPSGNGGGGDCSDHQACVNNCNAAFQGSSQDQGSAYCAAACVYSCGCRLCGEYCAQCSQSLSDARSVGATCSYSCR